jgi:hypothetical protein
MPKFANLIKTKFESNNTRIPEWYRAEVLCNTFKLYRSELKGFSPTPHHPAD